MTGGRFSGLGGISHFRTKIEVKALALTDTEIRRSKPAEKPYKLSDSGGLHLLVTPSGSKLWRLKYRFDGVEKLMALGRYTEISLV